MVTLSGGNVQSKKQTSSGGKTESEKQAKKQTKRKKAE